MKDWEGKTCKECKSKGITCEPPALEDTRTFRCKNCSKENGRCSVSQVIFHEDYIPSCRKPLTIADLEEKPQAEENTREMEEAMELLEGEVEEWKETAEKLQARMKLKDDLLLRLNTYRTRVLAVLDNVWDKEVEEGEALERIENFTQTVGQDIADYEEEIDGLDGAK